MSIEMKHAGFCCVLVYRALIARFMGPTSGPYGADRTQVGPMLAHELCYLRGYMNSLQWSMWPIDVYYSQTFHEFDIGSPRLFVNKVLFFVWTLKSKQMKFLVKFVYQRGSFLWKYLWSYWIKHADCNWLIAVAMRRSIHLHIVASAFHFQIIWGLTYWQGFLNQHCV